MCNIKAKERVRFQWSKPQHKLQPYGTGQLAFSTIGLTAISAAFQMGCSEIHLAGIDLCSDEEGHMYFYNRGRVGKYFNKKQHDRHVPCMQAAIDSIKAHGVKVVQRNKRAAVTV
jgi:hypothetical protein